MASSHQINFNEISFIGGSSLAGVWCSQCWHPALKRHLVSGGLELSPKWPSNFDTWQQRLTDRKGATLTLSRFFDKFQNSLDLTFPPSLGPEVS